MRSTAVMAISRALPPPHPRAIDRGEIRWQQGWYILPGAVIGLAGWYGILKAAAWLLRSLVPG